MTDDCLTHAMVPWCMADRYPRGPEDDIALMMHGLEMLTAKYRNKLAVMKKTAE